MSDAAKWVQEQIAARDARTPGDQFNSVFGKIGQYSSGLSSEYNGGPAGAPLQKKAANQGGFSGFLQHSLDVSKQMGSLLSQGARLGGKFVVNSAVDIASSARGSASTLSDLATYPIRTYQNEERSKVLREKLKVIGKDYAAGKMSRENYTKSRKEINKGFDEINKSANQIATSKSAGERNKEIIDTTINILSLGSLGLAKIGGKTLVEQGIKQGTYKILSKEALDAAIQQSATSLEKLMLKNGTARNLVTRNLVAVAQREAQKLAGESAWQFAARNSKKIAVDLLIKRPVFYQSNIDQSQSLYKNLLENDYKGAVTDAAWLAVQTLNGGPLGKAKDFAGYAKTAITKRAKGAPSVLDELSKRIGNGDWKQFGEYVANSGDSNIKKYAQVLQDSNLNVTKGDVNRAVDNILSSYAHIDPAKLTPQMIIDDIKKHRDAFEAFQTYVKSGLTNLDADYAAKLVPVRWNAVTRTAVADKIAAAGDDKNAWKAIVEEIGDKVGFTNNYSLSTQIDNILANSNTAEEASRAIQNIDAAVGSSKYIPKPLQQRLAKLGYVLAEPVAGVKNNFIETEDLTKLISNAVKNPAIFDPSAAPTPIMGAVAKAFEKMGISPQDSNQYASRQLSQHVVARITNTEAGRSLGLSVGKEGDIAKGGEVILAKLQQFIEDKAGVRFLDRVSAGQSSLTDVRQMTLNEIQQALKSKNTSISEDQAKEIRKAIIKGFQDVPLEIRGAGDMIVDTLYGANPMQKWYARTQSALRYTYNPFFRIQESAETKILSHVQASNLVWMKPKSQLDEAARMLEEGGIFKGQLPGEAAGDVTLGRITANLTKGQKRDLGGLALDIANHQGVDLQTLVRENPDMLDDALRVVVQYPKKGVLASPLARTLNLVFFPMRYNAKVTMLAADALSKQPPAIQKAMLHSMFTMKDWLKSDEGINWQSQHADAIQLLKWITPVNSIEGTMKILMGSLNSPADLGQLGGLPLGVITQILDGQGLINLNTPYVDPKTGNVFPRNTPVSLKGRTATALVDLLNSTFTYPGRVLGLPGKNQELRGLVQNFISTNGTDFEPQDQEGRLTPLQQNWIRVLKGDTSDEAIDSLYQSPAPGQFNGYTLPPLTLPFNPSFDSSSKYKAPTVPKTLAKGKKQKPLAPVTKQPL